MFFTLCSQPALSTLLYIIFPRHGLFLFSLSSSSLSSYRPQFTFLIKTGRGRVVSFSFSKEGGRGGIKKKFCISASLPPPPSPTSRPFFRKSRNAIRGQNLPVLHFAHYLPKPWTDGFAYVNGRQGW